MKRQCPSPSPLPAVLCERFRSCIPNCPPVHLAPAPSALQDLCTPSKKVRKGLGGGGSIDEMFRCSFMTPHHFLPSHWTCALAPERHMRVVKVTLAAMRDLSQIMFGSNDTLLLLMWMEGRCQTGDADLCGWVASTSSPLHSLGLAVCIHFLLFARAVAHETALLQILYRHFPR